MVVDFLQALTGRFCCTVKPVLSGHSKRRQKLVFKTNYPLMQVKSIAECSKGSILQYFRPSLSYHLSLRDLFCLFLSGCLRQVLLYWHVLYREFHYRRFMCLKIKTTHYITLQYVYVKVSKGAKIRN